MLFVGVGIATFMQGFVYLGEVTSISSSIFASGNLSTVSSSNATVKVQGPVVPGDFRPEIDNVYMCGYDNRKTFNLIFPEYAHVPTKTLTRQSANNATDRDIVVNGLGGNCDGWRKRKLTPKWMSDNFPGKAIHFNGEAFGGDDWANGAPHPRQYHIGYVPDSTQSIQVTLLALGFIRNSFFWDTLLNHTSKPKNTKEEFMIYTATHCMNVREEAAGIFSEILPIHYGGGCKGTMKTTNPQQQRSSSPSPYTERKHDGKRGNGQMWNNAYINRHYRFCLSLENTKIEGYITEKILAAFQGGCIPIYWGTTEVFDLFNSKAFIYYDFDNPQLAIDRVRYLESNQTAYDEVMNEKILKGGNETINKFLSLTEMLGDGSLQQKIRSTIFPPLPAPTPPTTSTIETT